MDTSIILVGISTWVYNSISNGTYTKWTLDYSQLESTHYPTSCPVGKWLHNSPIGHVKNLDDILDFSLFLTPSHISSSAKSISSTSKMSNEFLPLPIARAISLVQVNIILSWPGVVQNLKVRPYIMNRLDIWWNQRASDGITTGFPSQLCSCR